MYVMHGLRCTRCVFACKVPFSLIVGFSFTLTYMTDSCGTGLILGIAGVLRSMCCTVEHQETLPSCVCAVLAL